MKAAITLILVVGICAVSISGRAGIGESVTERCTEGESRPSPDGCNMCYCADGPNGVWACTAMACAPNPLNEDVCRDGETKPADDGCNTCYCYDNTWACTEMWCVPGENVCREGETKPADDGCNTCYCYDNTWACTEVACSP